MLWLGSPSHALAETARNLATRHCQHSCTISRVGEAGCPDLPPLRTVRAAFTAHGSSSDRQDSVSPEVPRYRVFGSVYRMAAVANFYRTDLFHAVPPVLTCFASAPFRVGYCPIQRVMDSPCLSAAGLRFAKHPFPLRSHVPYGSPTVCCHTDRIGVAAFRSSKMRLGWVPSFCRGRGVRNTSRHKRGIHSYSQSEEGVP